MKSINYKKLMGVLLLSLLVTVLAAQVKIGDNPATKDASSVLELEKSNQGLLIPRVALSGATDVATIPSPAHSLLVFNTATAGGSGNEVYPGFYYWDSGVSRWKGLMTSAGPAGDVWIDDNSNIISVNSASQSLSGSSNVALGNGAFGDPVNASNYIIAIGIDACNSEETTGDAYTVAIGHSPAYSNSGINVNAIGPFAAYDNSGSDVNAFGADAAFNNPENHINALGNTACQYNSGSEINAFGPESCQFNYGDVVNAMGWQSAESNGGDDINAFGVRAAQNNNDTANRVNAIGLEAAQNNAGNAVNALGEGAGRNNEGSLVNFLGPSAGENNLAWSVNLLGSQSGQYNEGAEVNAMGAMSAQYNTTACVNAFGLEAAKHNTGYGTNALGLRAAKWNDGEHAVAIGEDALQGGEFISEGIGNIGIGYQAGDNVNTGQYNICIGYDTEIPDSTLNDQINIGNKIIRYSDGVIELKDLIQLTPTTMPTTPLAGMIFMDSGDSNTLKVFDGTVWHSLW